MMARPCVFDDLVGQQRVADFLNTSVREDRVSHAYLFVGPPGAGKKTAAKAFACAVLCDDDGCGACASCYRIKRGLHPDVHIVQPAGAATYMVGQIRGLIHDTNLKPVEGDRKIYIIEDADAFNDGSANAFLKTLEEPPDDVVIILLAHSFDSVIPTIASRCQVVRFRPIPPSLAEGIIIERTGVDVGRARAALAAAGGVIPRASEYIDSSTKREARERVLATLKDLATMDGHDVLLAVRDLLAAVKAPLEEVKALQAEEVREREEFLGTSSGKDVADRHKRELTARERDGVIEILNVTESWLRDCLAISQGAGDVVANVDVIDAMEEVAAVITTGAAGRALRSVKETRKRVSYNVNPQLAIEAMLFDIQEVLICPR